MPIVAIRIRYHHSVLLLIPILVTSCLSVGKIILCKQNVVCY
jgi:hypothetical protein